MTKFILVLAAWALVAGSIATSAGLLIPGFPIVLVGLLGMVLGAAGASVATARMNPWRE